MKHSRLFLFSILFCLVVSLGGSFLMIRTILSRQMPTGAMTANFSKPISSISQESVSSKLSDLESGVKALAAKVSPSVVSIIVSKDVPVYRTDPFGFFYEPAGTERRKLGGGTGFFIDKNGYILTNKHVVADPSAEYSVILSNGEELVGKVLAIDPTNDLAVMRAFRDQATPYASAVPVSFVESQEDVEVGSFVVAIGNALSEFQNTLTFGVVSGLGRSIEAGNRSNGDTEALSGLIQTDTAINPGNSGGPLVNLEGKVVGINTAISQGANGIGFAIPLSKKMVASIQSSVVQYGAIKRPFVGVRYTLLSPETAKDLGLKTDHGAYIGGSAGAAGSAVVPGSPADAAGLKDGDVIVEVDGKTIQGTFGLKESISERLPGETVSLKVVRKSSGKTEVVPLKLGEAPTK